MLSPELLTEALDTAKLECWEREVAIQQKLRKQVKLRLIKSDISMSGSERTQLTNRIVELARAHYKP